MGYLTFEKRKEIKKLLNQGVAIQRIAKELGVSRETIYNELRRGKDETGVYNPVFSEQKFQLRQRGKGRVAKLKESPELAAHIAELLLQNKCSPRQVIEILEEELLDKDADIPSVNTIYSAIDKGLLPSVTRESIQPNKTKMFSNGMVCIPKWIRERFHFSDGDVFSVEILDDGTVIMKNQGK